MRFALFILNELHAIPESIFCHIKSDIPFQITAPKPPQNGSKHQKMAKKQYFHLFYGILLFYFPS